MKNPTLENTRVGNLKILRLEPGDQVLKVNYFAGPELDGATFRALFRPWPGVGRFVERPCENGEAILTKLQNNKDYTICIVARDRQGKVLARSEYRMFRCAFVPGKVVAYIHPDDHTFASSGRSTCSPSIVRAPDGALVVSHDFYWKNSGQNITHVYRSTDEGSSWHFAAEIEPCFWGSLFVHREKLYILATTTQQCGACVLYASEDSGFTWAGPLEIVEGGPEVPDGGIHKAPMPVVAHKGRLWTGIEVGVGKEGIFKVAAVSCDASAADLMDKSKWTVTAPLPYDASKVKNVEELPSGTGTIEGNVVVGKDDTLYNVLRYHIAPKKPGLGKAYVVKLDASNPKAMPRYHGLIDFPGNLTKFYILYDEKTKYYYALSNRLTLEVKNQRNILTLSKSADLFTWITKRDILNYADNCFHEDESKCAFQYPSFIFDGDDILAVSRTALNNAHNFHDANYITFHRIKNYAY